MPKRGRFIFVLLLLVIESVMGPIMSAGAKPPLPLAIKRQQLRGEYVKFETVIDALDVSPGMTILDIGSGPGYATFLFAEKLHGTGKVFATDVRADFVEYIDEEAKRRGLINVYSALVRADGLDDFYGRHHYDIVFLSNVYHCLDQRIEYFSGLRAFLKPNARLVLILYNQVPLFSVDDFSNMDGLIKSLKMMAGNDPFIKHLSTATRQLLKDNAEKKAVEAALVDDFNRMLTDPDFYKEFYSGFYFNKDFFTSSEREFANWLLMTIQEDGIVEKPVHKKDAKAMRTVIKLNRLFFMKRFGDYLANSGMGAYLPAGDANRHTSKYVMFRELDAAGYKLLDQFNFSPYYDVLIMIPKTP